MKMLDDGLKKIKNQLLSAQVNLKEEKLSIKVKLVISHILIAVLTIIIITYILTTQAGNSLLEKVNSSNVAYVSKVTKILDGNIKSIEDITRIIVADLELNAIISKNVNDYNSHFAMSEDRKNNYDKKISALQYSNTLIKNIFLVKENETIGKPPLNQQSFADEFYKSDVYKQVDINKKNPSWFFDLYGTHDLYVMRVINNIDTGKFIGVLIIQVKKELLTEELENGFGSMARLAILNSSGKVVLTPEKQEKMDNILYFDQLKSNINKKKENKEPLIGTFTIKKQVEVETTILYGECSNQWIYLMQIPVSEFLGDIQRIKTIAIILLVIITILAVIVGIWIAITISRPIEYIRNKIKLVEQGDLTVQSKYRGIYEIGQLSKSFNHMTSNMKNLIYEVGLVAEKVSTNSSGLEQISKNSAQASKEVMLAVESVTSGATQQASAAENTMNTIYDLVNQFSATREVFNNVVKLTSKTRVASQDTREILDILNLTTKDTVELSQNIQQDIKNLIGRFSEISGIIGTINNISKQTNLLALNAKIEAARAGEAGRGFAVVADEVEKLALQSSAAGNSISEMIKGIFEETTKTENMIINGAGIYIKQEQAVNNTETNISEIINNMNTIITEVNMVYGLLEGMDEVQIEASTSISSIVVIAQDAAAAIEEVLASGQEQLATADQLVNMSLDLGNVITTMEEQLNQFII